MRTANQLLASVLTDARCELGTALSFLRSTSERIETYRLMAAGASALEMPSTPSERPGEAPEPQATVPEGHGTDPLSQGLPPYRTLAEQEATATPDGESSLLKSAFDEVATAFAQVASQIEGLSTPPRETSFLKLTPEQEQRLFSSFVDGLARVRAKLSKTETTTGEDAA